MTLWTGGGAQWWTKKSLYACLRWWARDAVNVLTFGPEAPRFAELIYVPTAACTAALKPYVGHRKNSGKVMEPSWTPEMQPVESVRKVEICLRHWREGMSWEDAGAYENAARKIAEKGNADWCTTLEEVVSRYENLDRVFEVVRAEGRLRATGRVGVRGGRVLDGTLVHIDERGNPIAGGGGWHRLGMALALDLPEFPAQIGMVHPQAIPEAQRVSPSEWATQRLRFTTCTSTINFGNDS